MKVPKNKLGNTGLELPVLGFGASGLGGIYGDVSQENSTEAVHHAVELGINYFDSSPFYGLTKSEQALGIALQGIPREQVVISTKVGRYDSEKFDFSAARVKQSVQESLGRIKVKYLDIVYIHDVEFGDFKQIIDETLPALKDLQKSGVIKNIGFSCLPLKAFRYILDRVPVGYVDCIMSYCHNSLNDNSLTDFIPYLQEKQVGIINASPLSMSLLTPQGPPDWHPAPKDLKDAAMQASKACQQHGVSLPDLAIKNIPKETRIASTLVGMTSKQQVQQNYDCLMSVINKQKQPSNELTALKEVEKIFEKFHNVTWQQGRPENN